MNNAPPIRNTIAYELKLPKESYGGQYSPVNIVLGELVNNARVGQFWGRGQYSLLHCASFFGFWHAFHTCILYNICVMDPIQYKYMSCSGEFNQSI